MKSLPAVHPGDVLREEFMRPLGLAPEALALLLGVRPELLRAVTGGRFGITADLARRLAVGLGVSERFWLGLQADHDADLAYRASTGV